MPRLSQAAVEGALVRLAALQAAPKAKSWLEVFLVGKRIQALGATSSINEVNNLVTQYFVVLPAAAEGRIEPFRRTDPAAERPAWGIAKDSGRKTVWNAGTRNPQKSLFEGNHMGRPMVANAANILASVVTVRPDPLDLAVFFLRDTEIPDATAEAVLAKFRSDFSLSEAELALITEESPPPWSTRPLFAGGSWSANALRESLRPLAVEEPAGTYIAHPEEVAAPSPFTADARVARMLRTAVEANICVVAVGPPGTGKTTYLEQMATAARHNPGSFGFAEAPGPYLMVTPDESWTTRELLGGESVVDGKLTFTEGWVLRAIARNAWILLDEMNRADLDRIFGGLFTWLSGKSVSIGKEDSSPNARSITLGWAEGAQCQRIETATEIRYLAGTEWRLLGTYNATDAAKVFRFGQALSRRFVRVPIPVAEPLSLVSHFELVCSGLPGVAGSLLRLYEAHHEVCPIGPASFLTIPDYIKAHQALEDTGIDQEELLAEAYVMALGGALNRLDDDQRATMGELVVAQKKIFSTASWQWVLQMAALLG